VPHVRKPVIGLLGGIGSGKSRVAGALAEAGATVVDADRLCHEALDRADVRQRVVQRWGEPICGPDGRVDRRRLGRIVFGAPDELKALTDILWPAIRPETLRRIEAGQADANTRAVVLDAALLLEAGWRDLCDRMVFVSTPAALRAQRVLAQRGWGKEELLTRESMQMPLEAKRAEADYLVDNGGPWPACREQLHEVLANITGEKAPTSRTGR
jgi:dephospho-CoA kinase